MKNLSFFFLPDRPTKTLATRNKLYVLPLFFFFFFYRPTDCRKTPREKSAIQGINRGSPNACALLKVGSLLNFILLFMSHDYFRFD